MAVGREDGDGGYGLDGYPEFEDGCDEYGLDGYPEFGDGCDGYGLDGYPEFVDGCDGLVGDHVGVGDGLGMPQIGNMRVKESQ